MKKPVALQLLDAMADIDALLGATMGAGTAQGGATADAGAGVTPAVPVGSRSRR